MRTAPVGLAARLVAESTTLARLWRVTRRDGVVFRFTDAVRPVSIAIAPDLTPQTYRSDISFTASAIFMSKTLANQQSVTLTFLLDDAGFSEQDLRTRKFDGATGEVFVVDYARPDLGSVRMYVGVFGEVHVSNQKIATVDVVPSDSSVTGRAIGAEKYSQTCRASLFDSRCKLVADDYKLAFTVTSASGGSIVSADITQDNGHWALGFVKWTTGDNAGNTSPVASNDKTSTSLFLSTPPPLPVQAGDTGFVYPGCDKTRARCKQFGNLLNMRAEPDVPDGALPPYSSYGTPQLAYSK